MVDPATLWFERMCPVLRTCDSKGVTSEGHQRKEVLETQPTKNGEEACGSLAAILRRREYQQTGLGHFIGYNLRKSVK